MMIITITRILFKIIVISERHNNHNGYMLLQTIMPFETSTVLKKKYGTHDQLDIDI